MIHDQLSALFRDTRPHPRFHTPAVSFDMSQHDLRDGVTLAPAGEAAVAASTAGLTWRPLRGAPSLTIHLVLPASSRHYTAASVPSPKPWRTSCTGCRTDAQEVKRDGRLRWRGRRPCAGAAVVTANSCSFGANRATASTSRTTVAGLCGRGVPQDLAGMARAAFSCPTKATPRSRSCLTRSAVTALYRCAVGRLRRRSPCRTRHSGQSSQHRPPSSRLHGSGLSRSAPPVSRPAARCPARATAADCPDEARAAAAAMVVGLAQDFHEVRVDVTWDPPRPPGPGPPRSPLPRSRRTPVVQRQGERWPRIHRLSRAHRHASAPASRAFAAHRRCWTDTSAAPAVRLRNGRGAVRCPRPVSAPVQRARPRLCGGGACR